MTGLVLALLSVAMFFIGNEYYRRRGFSGGRFPLLWIPKPGQTIEDWFPKR